MITHVAIKHNGKVYSLPKPFRHHHVIHMMVNICGFDYVPGNAVQGFLNEPIFDPGCFCFLNREKAYRLVISNDQLKDDNRKIKELYSEDLW